MVFIFSRALRSLPREWWLINYDSRKVLIMNYEIWIKKKSRIWWCIKWWRFRTPTRQIIPRVWLRFMLDFLPRFMVPRFMVSRISWIWIFDSRIFLTGLFSWNFMKFGNFFIFKDLADLERLFRNSLFQINIFERFSNWLFSWNFMNKNGNSRIMKL